MAATTDEQASEADLAAWISGGRHDILRAIRFHDGEANTSEIKDYSGVARGSFDHHISLLLNPPESLRAGVDWLDGEGLVEETGRVNVGTPVRARQFGLTDAGEKAFEMVIDDVSVRASDVRDLQQRVQELEGERDDLKTEIEELQQRYNQVADLVEKLAAGEDPAPTGER